MQGASGTMRCTAWPNCKGVGACAECVATSPLKSRPPVVVVKLEAEEAIVEDKRTFSELGVIGGAKHTLGGE
jgi:hypothetical protein